MSFEMKIEIGLVLAFIGTFDDHPPSTVQVSMFNAFLDKSLSQGILKENYVKVTENQLTNSGTGLGLIEVVGETPHIKPRKFLKIQNLIKLDSINFSDLLINFSI